MAALLYYINMVVSDYYADIRHIRGGIMMLHDDVMIENIKTTSMENVSTRVLEKIKKRRKDNQLQSLKLPCSLQNIQVE